MTKGALTPVLPFGPLRHAAGAPGRPHRPAFSFQLCPADSWPGNPPPGAVDSVMYFCARLLFHNSTDIRRTLPDLLSMRAHASQRCQLPFVRSTPRAVPAKGARYLFWADLTEPWRGPRRLLRHKPLYCKHLQQSILCGTLKPLQDSGLQPQNPFGGRCVLWGECKLQRHTE